MNRDERARNYERIQKENQRLKEENEKRKQLLEQLKIQEQEEERKQKNKKKSRSIKKRIKKNYETLAKKTWWKMSVTAVVLLGVVCVLYLVRGKENNPKQGVIATMSAQAEYNVTDFVYNDLKEGIEERDEELEEESKAQEIAESIEARQTDLVIPDWIEQDWLQINEYSRPGTPLQEVNTIVIHYVGNPGTSAKQNRSYFQRLAYAVDNPNGDQASSHFIVGLEGEIIQCVPISEISYCSNERNVDSIAIEVCHPDAEGKFTDVTYDSLVKLTAWLCEQLDLTSNEVIRHYDITGKLCPIYYVQHPEAWEQFLQDVDDYMQQNPDIQ